MDDGRPGGEGPSYIALLRWFWSFVGIKGQIGGSALQDGRYFLDAMALLEPGASTWATGHEVGSAEENFRLLEAVLSKAGPGLVVRDGLVADLEHGRFHAMHEFLRLLYRRATQNSHGHGGERLSAADSDQSPGGGGTRLDNCLARGTMWLLRLLSTWEQASPSSEAQQMRADARRLFSGLTKQSLCVSVSSGDQLGSRLCSGDIYVLACATIFHVPISSLRKGNTAVKTHAAILDFLDDHGYHVLDGTGDASVAAVQLAGGPASSGDARWVHLSVQWRLMEAYTHSVLDLDTLHTHVSVLKGLQHGRADGDNAVMEADQALLSWVEAVCAKFDRALATVQKKHGKSPHQIDRAMPDVTDLVHNFGDGICVPGLWSFYLPKQVPFSSVKIKGNLDGSPRAANWQLVRGLCEPLDCLVGYDEDGIMNLDRELDRPWVVALMAEWFVDFVGRRAGEPDDTVARTKVESGPLSPGIHMQSAPSQSAAAMKPAAGLATPQHSRRVDSQRSRKHNVIDAWSHSVVPGVDTAPLSRSVDSFHTGTHWREGHRDASDQSVHSHSLDSEYANAATICKHVPKAPRWAKTARVTNQPPAVAPGMTMGTVQQPDGSSMEDLAGEDLSQCGLHYDEKRKCWLSVNEQRSSSRPDSNATSDIEIDPATHRQTCSVRPEAGQVAPTNAAEAVTSAHAETDNEAMSEDVIPTPTGANFRSGDHPPFQFPGRPRTAEPSRTPLKRPQRSELLQSQPALSVKGQADGSCSDRSLADPVVIAEPDNTGVAMRLEERVQLLEKHKNLLKLEINRQRREFESEREQWAEQRRVMESDIMNEIYRRLKREGHHREDATIGVHSTHSTSVSIHDGVSAVTDMSQIAEDSGVDVLDDLRVDDINVSDTDESIDYVGPKPTSALPESVPTAEVSSEASESYICMQPMSEPASGNAQALPTPASTKTAAPLNTLAFKQQLQEDNARLQNEIARLKQELHSSPNLVADSNSASAMDTTAQATQVKPEHHAKPNKGASVNMWVPHEQHTDAELKERERKLEEFRLRKDEEARRRRESRAAARVARNKRRSDQQTEGAGAHVRSTRSNYLQAETPEQAWPSEAAVEIVYGSHAGQDGNLVAASHLLMRANGGTKVPDRQSRRRQGLRGGKADKTLLPCSPPELAEIKRMKEHVVSNRSNQQLVKNALSFVCMAGPRNPERLLVMELLEKYDGYNFLILLGRGNGQPFRALYVSNHDGSGSQKIYGMGPPTLEDKMVETAYKYDCGHKEFRAMSTNAIGNTCVAVVMLPKYYRSHKATVCGALQAGR